MKAVFDLILFIGALLLIVGLRYLSSPKTARKGNGLAAFGLGLGVLASIFYPLDNDYGNNIYIVLGLVLGGVVGVWVARKVAMTAMPEMVSLFNGFGGLCAMLIAIASINISPSDTRFNLVIILVNLFLGGVAFKGSMVAYSKLSGRLRGKYMNISFSKVLNIILLVLGIYLIAIFIRDGSISREEWLMVVGLSLLYGFVFVVPIGGADMPVVISLLNSLTGVTAAISGIITDDKLMLLGGILVGSSGTILTILMCKAMNRSLYNVIFGSFSSSGGGSSVGIEGKVREITVSDLAVLMAYANQVVIVPGYGLAVSQAQKICKEVEQALGDKGVELKYAIHPVAGRMPGHMNVLLAEAEVSYDRLMDLEESNQYLQSADVVIVVGANDVVNPSAKEDPDSNIYGMPIIQLDKVKNVVVIKRSMNPGYAGIQNPLFFKENTQMLFGDAKSTLNSIVSEIKNN